MDASRSRKRTSEQKSSTLPTATASSRTRVDDTRASQILDSLKTYQVGVANEIYSLFEQRSKQLEGSLLKIQELEQSYFQIQSTLKDKEAEIVRLRGELEAFSHNRAKFESQLSELTSEIERLRVALREAESSHRAINEEKARLEQELRGYFEKIKGFEAEIARYKTLLTESEERFQAALKGKERELEQLTVSLREIKDVNTKISLSIKEREQEIITLRHTVDQASNLQRVLHEKETELKTLQARYGELQKLFQDQRRVGEEKDAEIQKLELEVKEMRERYNNAKKANMILMKKVIVLSEDVDQAPISDDESDEELTVVRSSLQQRMNSLKNMFQTHEKDYGRHSDVHKNPRLSGTRSSHSRH
eukprot:gnl/Spiro4/22853_TR11271_c0_g1_i2.p1 gnl/Spiro4/22853_TR11271_c0_g1~~gnl/Spiro4/22853_TR11271_c0_g1_i2.p1  ORF type:complete len:374 (-),score=144.03 gnl/Spiro4/22853_TR11271_c0_g1_i2:90-1178(-)